MGIEEIKKFIHEIQPSLVEIESKMYRNLMDKMLSVTVTKDGAIYLTYGDSQQRFEYRKSGEDDTGRIHFEISEELDHGTD